MRATVVLVVLAVTVASARAETIDASQPEPPPATGKVYVALAYQTVVMSAPPDQLVVSFDHPIAIEGGLQLGSLPFYAHAVAATSARGYTSAAIGPELRVGNRMVKGVFGVDLGFQNDPRAIDAMYSVDGVFVAPRLGLEVGTRAVWVRGVFEGRTTLRSGPSGSAGGLSLAIGHDF